MPSLNCGGDGCGDDWCGDDWGGDDDDDEIFALLEL